MMTLREGTGSSPTTSPTSGMRSLKRRVWRLCHIAGIRSTISTRKRKHTPPGPPAHDDLVRRKFTAQAPNRLWFMDIERHEALLNLAVVKGHRCASVAAGV